MSPGKIQSSLVYVFLTQVQKVAALARALGNGLAQLLTFAKLAITQPACAGRLVLARCIVLDP